jgi:methylmalonyl-CoA mutase cobalamin-binding domain/chain
MSVESSTKELKAAFYAQDPQRCAELTQKALDAGANPLDLLEKNLLEWTKEITKRDYSATIFEEETRTKEDENPIMLSDLIMIGECLTASSNVLKLVLGKNASQAAAAGRIIMGTIEGDVHDIGRQIIATMWAAAGYEVIDLGYDIPPKVFAIKAKMKKADIIGISCSMGMARVGIGTTVEECEKAGIRNKVKIIDGGQAASYGDVETYKIDAFGAQTEDALKKASELMRILKEQKAQKGGE